VVDYIHLASKTLEIAGVSIILIGALYSTILAFRNAAKHTTEKQFYLTYRRQLSRAILLGLEFLVAADIIKTVAVTPTFSSLGTLAILVAIRTFLSFALEVEVKGHWPWSARGKNEIPS